MDDKSPFSPLTTPSAARPLLGMTVLVVEDSRFSSDALRLMCVRSGARIRRADCLTSARRHLQVYMPTVAIVDMGLPDGSGAELIEELHKASPRIELILGTSGDDFAQEAALAAGADGFIAKPYGTLTDFQQAILRRLPDAYRPTVARVADNEAIKPDPVAFRDDLLHAADTLKEGDEELIDYVAQFLGGLARSAGDKGLLNAVKAVETARKEGTGVRANVAELNGVVESRLTEAAVI
ncbi:response regulator [Shimia sp.]|jgi:DNA-binding response OmpR family regulator|uniref:response regulator n=1 Tax=unclassified Shimia TaxID=2630038 RepID=UPI0025F6E38E|nr:response regulator [Shimia sp.]MCH2068748.1 response regulator [Shimia sp.]